MIRKAIIKRHAKISFVFSILVFPVYVVIDLMSGDAITWMENLKHEFFLSIIYFLIRLASDIRLRGYHPKKTT